jgi:hypothetical protein
MLHAQLALKITWWLVVDATRCIFWTCSYILSRNVSGVTLLIVCKYNCTTVMYFGCT